MSSLVTAAHGAAGLGDIPVPGPPGSEKMTLGTLARINPQLAYALVGGGGAAAKLYGNCGVFNAGMLGSLCGGGFEIIDVRGCFNVGDCGSFVRGVHCQITGDLFVRAVKVTVRRPRAFAGNIFKAQSDYFNSLNSNIDVQLIIESWCKYVISDDFTPLENLPFVFECACPADFILRCNATIVAQFVNKRALAADEVPTEAIISFIAIRLPVPLSCCPMDEAFSFFSRYGVLSGTPDDRPPQLIEAQPAGLLPRS